MAAQTAESGDCGSAASRDSLVCVEPVLKKNLCCYDQRDLLVSCTQSGLQMSLYPLVQTNCLNACFWNAMAVVLPPGLDVHEWTYAWVWLSHAEGALMCRSGLTSACDLPGYRLEPYRGVCGSSSQNHRSDRCKARNMSSHPSHLGSLGCRISSTAFARVTPSLAKQRPSRHRSTCQFDSNS